MKFYLLFFILFFQWSFAQHDAIYAIGEKLINENKLDEAKVHFENNLKNTISDALKIKLLIGLADVHKARFNNLEASKNYRIALQLAKKTKNVQLEFLCYVKIGEFYRRRHLIPEFEKELAKATTLLKTHKIHDKYLTKYYNRKAALYTEFYNNNDSTLLYANKSLELAKIVKDKDNVFYSILEIAGVYERRREYKKSIQYLDSILDYSKKNNMVQHQSDAYISYIMALCRDNQKDKALEVALKAREFAKTNNLLIDENHFNEYIYQIYLSSENYKKVHEYLTYMNAINFKIGQIRNEKMLLELETKFQSKAKDNQLKINQLEILNKDKELVSNKAKLYILLLLFVVAVFMALLISYFYNRSKNSNKQLQTLYKQNEFLVSETNHRVNNNLQLIIVLISEELDKKQITDFDNSALNKILIKVESIATLHRHLYQATDKKAIDIEKYLNEIVQNFDAFFKEKNITVHLKLDKINVSIDFAMYIGLLTTELFINSIKYAFETNSIKLISLQAFKEEETLHFNYSDNGRKTIGKEIYPNLVVDICKQIKANYKVETKSGFEIYVDKKLTDINGKS